MENTVQASEPPKWTPPDASNQIADLKHRRKVSTGEMRGGERACWRGGWVSDGCAIALVLHLSMRRPVC